MELFRETLDHCLLSDVGFSGRWFIWERENSPTNNIKGHLDGGVANEKCLNLFPNASINHLAHTFFDHCPLLVSLNKDKINKGKRPFRFKAWWFMKDSFKTKITFFIIDKL